MLHVRVIVKEKPDYNVRTYVLPEYLALFYQQDAVSEGNYPEVFSYQEGSDSSPKQLADKLFAIKAVKSVKMEQNSFTITFEPEVNGPDKDEQVLSALGEVIATTLLVSVSYADAIPH